MKQLKIDDPIKFSFALSKLEDKLKVTKRKPATDPEDKVEGSGGGVGTNTTLEQLREKAKVSGDYTAVYAYKRAHPELS